MEPPATEVVLAGPNGAVVFRAVSDGAILLHTEDEVYYGLNAVGVRVWQLLPACRSLDELCAALSAEYPDATADQLRSDVAELLDDLGRAGLLVARS